jgi:hypothetical protein
MSRPSLGADEVKRWAYALVAEVAGDIFTDAPECRAQVRRVATVAKKLANALERARVAEVTP